MERNENKNELLYNLISVSLIVFIGLIVYSNTILFGWHFDDEPNIINNITIRDVFNLKAISSFDPSRFVTMFSLAVNYHFSGTNIIGYHVVNLTIHLIAAIFVWWLGSLLFQTPALKDKDYKFGSVIIPLFMGLIFVSHPVQTQAVTYIIQRAAALASLFYIGSLVFYIKYKLGGKNKTLFYSLSLLFCVLGMFSKEITFTLPFMLIIVEFMLFSKEKGFAFRQLIPFLFTLLIIPFVVVFVHNSAMKETAEAAGKISSITYLLTQFRVIVTYLRIFILPVGLNLDYDFALSKSFFRVKDSFKLFIPSLFFSGFNCNV